MDVLSGVPQGTILGHLLFIIYINDLPEVCKNLCSIFLYADDAKLYKHVLQDEDHTDLQTAVDSINIDKCKVALYGRHVTDYQYHMSHYGSDIALEKLSNIVDLGVNLDDKLSFKDHITDKINKAYGVLGIIKRNFDNLSTDAFLMLYKSGHISNMLACSLILPQRQMCFFAHVGLEDICSGIFLVAVLVDYAVQFFSVTDSTGYAQIYFPVDVKEALERNVHRNVPVADNIIVSMSSKIDLPSAQNNWETLTMEWSTADYTQQNL